MAFQPDFILNMPIIYMKYYEQQGFNNPEVYVESYVALNGRLSQNI
jgi:hypothetical protein